MIAVMALFQRQASMTFQPNRFCFAGKPYIEHSFPQKCPYHKEELVK